MTFITGASLLLPAGSTVQSVGDLGGKRVSALSKVLYPNDEPEIGKRLRLAQQYFFVSCSLQDMLRLLDLKGEPIERFPTCSRRN